MANEFQISSLTDIWDCCEGNKLHSIYPRLALSSVAKILPATIPSCSTDCKLVLVVSLTHTYRVVMTPQPVNLAEFHSQ